MLIRLTEDEKRLCNQLEEIGFILTYVMERKTAEFLFFENKKRNEKIQLRRPDLDQDFVDRMVQKVKPKKKRKKKAAKKKVLTKKQNELTMEEIDKIYRETHWSQ